MSIIEHAAERRRQSGIGDSSLQAMNDRGGNVRNNLEHHGTKSAGK